MEQQLSALDRARAQQQTTAANLPRRENVMATRWVWHPLMNISHLDVMAINGGEQMVRLKWQPVMQAPRWEPILSIPEDVRVATRPAPPEKPREAMYFIKPARIAESLKTLYAESGLVDSAVIMGAEIDSVEKLRLDDIFFPEAPDDLPGTFKSCDARITGQLDLLRKGQVKTPSGEAVVMNAQLIPHVVSVGEEMLAGLRRAALYVRRHLDERHAEMEKAKVDTTGRYRGTYDQKDYLMLAWLEVAPRDQALNQLATDRNNLPGVIGEFAKMTADAIANSAESNKLDVNALGAAIGAALAENLKGLFPVAAAPITPEIESVGTKKK